MKQQQPKNRKRNTAMKRKKKLEKRAMRWVTGIFSFIFSGVLLYAVYLSWAITISQRNIDDLLFLEAQATIYYAFGTTGLVALLTRKPPSSDSKIEQSALKGSALMIISFGAMGLLRECSAPWLQFWGYIMQIPLNIGINWFFARLGHVLDWLENHLDYTKLKKLFRLK